MVTIWRTVPNSREFEAEHLVEEDRPVEIGFAEAVGARVELLLVLLRLKAERIEIGVQVAARAVGADQHQGADRIARGALDFRRGNIDAAALRFALDLLGQRLANGRPVAVERRGEVAALRRRPVGTAPRRAARVQRDVVGVVLEALEEDLPLGVDRLRIGLVAGVQIVDVGGIAAVEK
jgi:hypothetical protein